MSNYRSIADSNKQRAKSLNLTEHFTDLEFDALVNLSGHKCVACGKTEDECELSADHIIPLSRGGTNTIDNIQILCRSCNSKKYNKAIVYDQSIPMQVPGYEDFTGERASFLVRIDPDILAKFDDLAWSHKVRRNELIAALIESYALGEIALSEERIQGNKRKKSGRPKKTEK